MLFVNHFFIFKSEQYFFSTCYTIFHNDCSSHYYNKTAIGYCYQIDKSVLGIKKSHSQKSTNDWRE